MMNIPGMEKSEEQRIILRAIDRWNLDSKGMYPVLRDVLHDTVKVCRIVAYAFELDKWEEGITGRIISLFPEAFNPLTPDGPQEAR